MVVKVGCLVYLMALLVGFLGGLILKVDFAGAVKKKRVTSCFGLKVIIVGYLCVSGPFTLNIYCGTISKLAKYHSYWRCYCSS